MAVLHECVLKSAEKANTGDPRELSKYLPAPSSVYVTETQDENRNLHLQFTCFKATFAVTIMITSPQEQHISKSQYFKRNV